MNDNSWRAPSLSGNAKHLMDLLLRRGGGMRSRQLIAAAGMPEDELVSAVNELCERGWVVIVWRSEQARRPESLPERFRDVRRIATNRTGRHSYRFLPRFQ